MQRVDGVALLAGPTVHGWRWMFVVGGKPDVPGLYVVMTMTRDVRVVVEAGSQCKPGPGVMSGRSVALDPEEIGDRPWTTSTARPASSGTQMTVALVPAV